MQGFVNFYILQTHCRFCKERTVLRTINYPYKHLYIIAIQEVTLSFVLENNLIQLWANLKLLLEMFQNAKNNAQMNHGVNHLIIANQENILMIPFVI